MKNQSIFQLCCLGFVCAILMMGCSKEEQDVHPETHTEAFPVLAAFHQLDIRIQKVIRALQDRPAVKNKFIANIEDKGNPAWQHALVSLRNNTLVALVPIKKQPAAYYEGFVAIEMDSILRFRVFDPGDSAVTAATGIPGEPSSFEVNHALNALNHRGFGRTAYSIKALQPAELKKLEHYKASRPRQQRIQATRSDFSYTTTTCYSWSACTGDGNGNCVGEIYHFTECVSETVWFKSYDEDSYAMGGGYGYEPGGGNSYYDPDIPSSAEDLQNVQLVPPLLPIGDLNNYLSCFDTSKPAKFFIYADQPVPGTSEPVSILGGIGHAYISFEQNVNGMAIRRTLGFYNQSKVDPFLNKTSASVLGNDSTHEYNIKWEADLSPDQFNHMVQATLNHASVYNIESYNCANFVLDVASAGGINLPRSTGWWYVGSGFNPGALGEDLRKQPGAVSGRGYTKDNVGECQ